MSDVTHTNEVRELADRLVTFVRSDPKAAVSILNDMELLAAEDASVVSRAFCIRARGNLLQVEGKLTDAIATYRDALQQFQAGGDEVEAARTASSLVGVLAPAGEYDEALRLADFARSVFVDANLVQRSARLDVNVGNIYHRLGKLDLAYERYQRAATALVESNDVEAAAGVMINSSVIAMLLYRFDESLDALCEATAYCRSKALTLLETQSEYNRAYLLYLMGRSLEALKILQTVERQFESHGDRFHVAQCRLDRSDIMAELNLHEDALDLALEAAALFDTLGAAADRARAFLLIGRCRVKALEFQKAIDAFAEAKSLFELEGNVVWSKLSDLEYAAVLLELSQNAKAAEILAQAAESLRKDGHAIYAVQADLLIVRARIAEGSFDEAGKVLAGVDVDALPEWLRYYACYLTGLLKESAGDVPAALMMYRRAARSLEFLAAHIGIDDFLLRFSLDKRDVYIRLIRLTNDPDEAFRYVERARAFDVQAPAREKPGRSTVESESYTRLRQALRADYVELFLKPANSSAALLDRIRAREREFVRNVRQDDIDQFIETPRKTPGAVQAISGNESILEFLVTDSELFVFVVHPEGVVRMTLPVSREELERETGFIRHYLAHPDSTLSKGLRSHLKKMYELVLEPVAGHFRERLIFVPDGCLHDIPFHALIGRQGYLADDYVVSYAPSAAALASVSGSKGSGTTAVLVGLEGEGIPSVARELKAVAARLPGAVVYQGKDISGALAALPTAGLIHIASHGLFRRDNPAFSMLMLGSDVLTAVDVQRLDLQAEMITISACSLGRASGRLEGFTRAFTSLGVATLVASLWDVDDETTAELMDAFYESLAAQADIALAMQQAMRKVRMRHEHPFYWAAFHVVGSPRLPDPGRFFKSACTDHRISQTH